MEWNNGEEQKRFEREQARLRKEYIAAGMTEEQITKLRAFDEEWFRQRRTEARHTQELDIYTSEDEERKDNPLIEKFPDKLTVTDKHWQGRYAWIEQIEDKRLYAAIKSLSHNEKEILTMLYKFGYTQTKIARMFGVKKAAISRKIGRIKNKIKNF